MNKMEKKMETKDIKARLEELPKKIFDKEIELLKIGDDYEEHQLRAKLIETTTGLEVAEETGTDGKKVFSNQDKRNIETKARLDKNPVYQDLDTENKQTKRDMKTEEKLIDFLKRQFRAAEGLARLGE